eukprot:scaffold6435_cov61-Cylindrotheca_fusiformis.AAC.2
MNEREIDRDEGNIDADEIGGSYDISYDFDRKLEATITHQYAVFTVRRQAEFNNQHTPWMR